MLDKYINGYFVADLLFCIIFIISYWLEHSSDLFLTVFLITILVSYYPIYIYWCQSKQKTNQSDRAWNHDYEFFAVLYTFLRGILFVVFILDTIILTANIDVIHILHHLSVFSYVSIFAMGILLIIITTIAYTLCRKHAEKARQYYSSYSDSTVFLIPSDTGLHKNADEITRSIMDVDQKLQNTNVNSILLSYQKK